MRNTALSGLIATLAFSAHSQEQPAMLPPISVTAGTPVFETPSGLQLNQPAASGSRMGLTPMETPASVEILPGATIRERGHTTVSEAVSRATGFTSVATPGNGGTSLSTRGFTGHGSIMQLYDGTQFYVGAGTVTFPFDTWTLDRVEVLRGPASVLYGAGAVGGVLNAVPKQPGRFFDNEALLEYGSDMTATAAAGSGGPLSEKLSYRADVVGRRSEGWVDRGDSESVAFSLALRADISENFAVTLRNDYGFQQPMRYWGTPLVNGKLDESLREKNYNAGNSLIEYRDNWTQLKFDWQAADNVRLSSTAYVLVSDRHWRSIEDYNYNPATGLIDRGDYLEILHNQEQYGNRFDVSIDSSLFGLGNQTVVGFDVNRIDFRHSNNSPYGGASTVDPYDFDPGRFNSPDPTTPAYDTQSRQYSVFAEDRLKLTGRWSLIGGLRYDHVSMKRGDLRDAANNIEKTFTNTTWRAGTVFDLSDTTALYGQYATAVDPVGGLITLSPANRSFDLATGEQVEIGVKQSFMQGRGEWTLAGYHIMKKDILSRSPEDPALTQQVGEQSSRGIEAAVGFDVSGTLRLEANAALLDAEFDEFTESVAGVGVSRAGNTPPNVPERVANLWLTWIFAPEWKARGAVRYVGETWSDNANMLKRPDYTLVDLGVAWSPVPDVSIALQVFNVFDEVYAIATYNDQWLLGRPRTALLSTSVRF